jgi:hypothetical protein
MAIALKLSPLLLLTACLSEAPPQRIPQVLAPAIAQHPFQQARLNLGNVPLTPASEVGLAEGSLLFTLDDRYPTEGAKIRFSDLWSSAEVWLDDAYLGTVEGGSFPGEIEVGDFLRPGSHRLGLRVRSPGKKSGLLLGARKEVDYQKPSLGGIELLLAPANHIDWLALPFKNGKVRPKAAVHKAPEGARVRFEAGLDGQSIQHLGEANVVDGLAVADEIDWKGKLWSPDSGATALYQFSATLLNADGKPIDHYVARNGLRETATSTDGFLINGKKTPVIAVRMEESWKNNETNLNELLEVGINSIEIHGTYPTQNWMNLADEAGIQVVVLPRCDGEVMASVEDVVLHQSTLLNQQTRLAESNAHHPSLLFWTTEGNPEMMKALANTFSQDPLKRLVTGSDIPALSLSSRNPKSLLAVKNGSWITEITNPPGTGPEAAIHLFRTALEKGAMGGVLPVDRNHRAMRKTWLTQLQIFTESLGISSRTQSKRRSTSHVVVSGLTTATPVWLEAPFTMAQGSLADPKGNAELSVFHSGSAGVSQDQITRPIELVPNTRQGNQVQSAARRIQWNRP